MHSLEEAALGRFAVLCYHRGEQELSLSHVPFLGFVPFHLLHVWGGQCSGGGWPRTSVPGSWGSMGLECSDVERLLLCSDVQCHAVACSGCCCAVTCSGCCCAVTCGWLSLTPVSALPITALPLPPLLLLSAWLSPQQ